MNKIKGLEKLVIVRGEIREATPARLRAIALNKLKAVKKLGYQSVEQYESTMANIKARAAGCVDAKSVAAFKFKLAK